DRGPLGDRVAVRAVGGRDHVVRLERGADAGRDVLLADGDVQEAGQLARAAALLHLLLEAADDEHLPEERAQALVGQAGVDAFDLGQGGHYADRPMRLADQWRAIEARLPDGWEDVRLTLTPEDPRELGRAAAVLGPVNAGRVDGALVFHVRRGGGASGPEGIRRLLERLDERQIGRAH